MQTYYIGVRWKEGGVPEIQGTSVSNVAEIKLTEKGYFIYAYEYVIAHASLRQYWRIEPLPGRLPGTDGEIHIRTKLCELQCACHKLEQ